MGRRCAVCNKGTHTGNNVAHSNLKTKRVWLPNLQRICIVQNGRRMKAYVCTSCIKSGKVERAI